MARATIPEQLERARAEYAEIEGKIVDPRVMASPVYRELTQRYAHLRDVIELGQEWEKLQRAISEEEELWEGEEDLRDEIGEALAADRRRLEEIERRFRDLLVPPDPNDQKTAIVEIRGGEVLINDKPLRHLPGSSAENSLSPAAVRPWPRRT